VACFGGLDGQFLGARLTGEGVSSDSPALVNAESEGLTVWDFHGDGHEDLFVVTLENEWTSDEMVLQAYSEVQDPERYVALPALLG
jgi:hypothetical protein